LGRFLVKGVSGARNSEGSCGHGGDIGGLVGGAAIWSFGKLSDADAFSLSFVSSFFSLNEVSCCFNSVSSSLRHDMASSSRCFVNFASSSRSFKISDGSMSAGASQTMSLTEAVSASLISSARFAGTSGMPMGGAGAVVEAVSESVSAVLLLLLVPPAMGGITQNALPLWSA
jgi:hypothetical protein